MHCGIIITLLAFQATRPCSSSRCYDKTCFTKNCLQEAIEANAVSTCQMDEGFGCTYTEMVSSSVMIIAECARSDCSPFHSAPTHEKLCCTDDLCNNGTYVPDESAENPCHSYTCTSGWDCLQAGILDGYSRTCPSDARYGCFVHKSQAGGITSVRAGCSKHTCQSVYAEAGPNKDEYTCCTGNLCNDGNKRDEENKNTSENNTSGLRHVTSRDVLVTIYVILITIINTI